MLDLDGAHYDVLIVGGGHAGAQTAVALRQRGFDGTLAILGDEPELPYERPPLSKEYLAGGKPFERILIRPAAYWAERRVAMLAGRRVTSVAPARHLVTTADGATVGYGRLVWAAGGRARRLTCAGHHLVGVHTVRSRADVDRMVAELPTVDRVVVIGGGYIGLEAAAVLAKTGKQVVLLEALPRVLARVAGEPLSRFYEAEHRAHGVDLRLEARVDCIEEADGCVAGVRLADGSVLPCEMVIVGVGIVPEVEPLADVGAAVSNGVEVDEACRSSLPDVLAVGDCACHRSRFADGAAIRLESVQNANDMAVVAARTILGEDARYDAVPWFWSNQYDLRLQTVGLSTGHDEVVLRGDPTTRSFALIYRRGGRVVALDCVNAARDYVQGRGLVEAGSSIDPARLADPTVPLKELLA